MDQIIYFCGTYLIYISAIYAVLFIFFKRDRKHFFREVVLTLGTGVIAWVIGHYLKDILAHPRPDVLKTLITPDDIYSLPSGHASFMFALGSAMFYLNKRAGEIIILLALVTGIARVMAGVHFWYDILGGALLGYFVACAMFYFYKKFFK